MTDTIDLERAPARQRLPGPGWLVVTVPLLPPVLLWMTASAMPLPTMFATPAEALRHLAILAALVGYAAFATNLVLGARIRTVERLFRSLDRLYKFHRRLGATAGGLLLGHVILLVASRAAAPGASVAGLFLPDPGWVVFSGVVAAGAMAAALLVTLFVRLRHEAFVWVQRSFGLVFAIGSVHAFRVPGMKAVAPGLTAYLGALAAVAGGAYVYRSVLGRTLVRRHSYTVEAVRLLDPTVAEVTLSPRDEPLSFQPGQFLFVSVDDEAVNREPHPFSITSAPTDEKLRLVVKALGDFTGALGDVEPGARARVEGPFGGFWHLDADSPRQVWIAGGIGVTPFLSMARSFDFTGHEVDFYYATQDADAAYFLDEFFATADRHPQLRVVPIRETVLGFLSATDVDGVTRDLSSTDIFICGPPVMISTLKRQFRALGVPGNRIHYEDFNFA